MTTMNKKFNKNLIYDDKSKKIMSSSDIYLLKCGIIKTNCNTIFGENYKEIINKMYLKATQNLGKSPNSMHKYGNSDIIEKNELEILEGMTKKIICNNYGFNENKKMSLFIDFSVHYGGINDKKLDIHRDDSDITINICLKNNFKTTGLRFHMISDSLYSFYKYKIFDIDLEEGDVVIHRGDHEHEVVKNQEIENLDKNRVNLILWFKFI